jgi:hypothetical protein
MYYEAIVTIATYVKAESEDLAVQQIANDWDVLNNGNLDWWIETESIKPISEMEWSNNGLE